MPSDITSEAAKHIAQSIRHSFTRVEYCRLYMWKRNGEISVLSIDRSLTPISHHTIPLQPHTTQHRTSNAHRAQPHIISCIQHSLLPSD